MPIEIGSLFSSTGWLFPSTLVNEIVLTTWQYTLLISIILLFIIAYIYPCQSGTPLSRLLTLFLYIYGIVFTALITHSGIINYTCRSKNSSDENEKVINRIISGGVQGLNEERVDIMPSPEESPTEEPLKTEVERDFSG